MSSSPPRLLLASIHDVSPRFDTEIAALKDIVAEHVGNCMAMLVVPNHWGDAPIIPGSAFATRLRAWADQGVEMFLHGFFHHDDTSYDAAADRFRAQFMTAGEGEFLGLSESEAAQRIADGRSLLAAAALRHAPIEVLRVGVHPPDVRHPTLVRSIGKTFKSAARARRPARYSELLN